MQSLKKVKGKERNCVRERQKQSVKGKLERKGAAKAVKDGGRERERERAQT